MRRSKKALHDLDLSVYTKNGTLRKRKQKTSRNYFTQDTEDAIISYNTSDCQVERNRLFNDDINDALHKLAENIIHTFKFYYTDLDNVEDLKHEVVYFLLTKIHLYDQNEGKAYSYFGTIAKRYLINYNDKQYKLQKDRKEMDHVDEDKKVIAAVQEAVSDNDTTHFVKSFIRFVELGIDDLHETRTTIKEKIIKDSIIVGERDVVVKDYVIFSEKDKDIVYTILDLLKNAEDIPEGGFYKPALYLQIREVTGQKTVDITRVVKILKCIMKQQANIYYKKGCLDIDEPNIYIQ
jgi:DNA-directed RNA polymerase specialized sigma24 family protein